MASSASSPDSADEFQDPLENYDPKTYDDPLERALAEETVRAIQHEPFVTVAADTLTCDAIESLAGLHVACLLVTEDDKLVGVFSDRDVLDRVALDYGAVRDAPVSHVMTPDPVVVYETDSAAAALSVMAVSGYRHVPVIDLKGKPLGIISPQRVTRFLQSHVRK